MRPIDAERINPSDIFGGLNDFAQDCRNAVVELIGAQPTIDPEDLRTHGKWIMRVPGVTWECSECEKVVQLTTPYCPNCGAKMDKE